MTAGTSPLCRLGDAQVWRLELLVPEPVLASRLGSLSARERERADRLAGRPDARRRFVAARGGLRELLADHLGVGARALAIVEGPHGKPELRGGPFFSLSHSGDLALCAVSATRVVGVDVEELRPVPGAEEIAHRWFTPGEWSEFRSAPGGELERAFFRVWTRKEAYLKALGIGLSGLSARGEVDGEAWEVHDLELGADHVASLVVARARRSAEAAG